MIKLTKSEAGKLNHLINKYTEGDIDQKGFDEMKGIIIKANPAAESLLSSEFTTREFHDPFKVFIAFGQIVSQLYEWYYGNEVLRHNLAEECLIKLEEATDLQSKA